MSTWQIRTHEHGMFQNRLNSRKSLGDRDALVDDFETGGYEMKSLNRGARNELLVTPRVSLPIELEYNLN